ncbi:MAG: hypothetical protein RIR11_1695 [Bacteroidota bacterium]|jgi:hypothetical protein
MNRQFYILAALAVLLIFLFYTIGNKNQKPRFDWNESGSQQSVYNESNTQPYGSRVFHQILDNYFPNETLTDIKDNIAKTLPQKETLTNGNYVFIGSGLYLDSMDTQSLLHFVKNGNTALIISKTIPFDLMNLIYYDECTKYEGWDDYAQYLDTSASMRLLAPDSIPSNQVKYAVQNRTKPYQWSYIPSYVFCPEQQPFPVGYIEKDSMINFAVFPHGKGRFLLHTTPLNFSNMNLLRAEAQPYTEGVLSYLEEGPIWWDGFSRVSEQLTRHRNNRRSGGSGLPEEHLLSFILQKEALAWAWYILLGLALLYLIFRTLRKQRAIPVLPKNENSSYEFIKTISNLHFKSGNFKGISIQAMKLFLASIREKYGLSASVDPVTHQIYRMDEDYYRKLAHRSGIDEQQIRVMFTQYETISRFEPTEQHAVDFYMSMEGFWKKANGR